MKYACETRLGNGTIWPILREGESNIPYYVRERRAKDFHIQCNQTDRLPATKPLRKNIERLRSLSCVASDAWLSKVTASQKTQERGEKEKEGSNERSIYSFSLSLEGVRMKTREIFLLDSVVVVNFGSPRHVILFSFRPTSQRLPIFLKGIFYV